MSEHKHHTDLISSFAEEYSDILNNSDQAVYVYLDDVHKVCNKNFSDLLGYSSEEEWAKVETSFPEAFVMEESQETLVTAYQNAMDEKTASNFKVTWKKKDGSPQNSTVILVPVSHEGHLFALHFVTNN